MTGAGFSRSGEASGERAFTLVELLIAIAIISILVAILVPLFIRNRASAQVAASKTSMRNLGLALEHYFVDEDAYPVGVGPAASMPDRPGVVYACHKGWPHGRHTECGSSGGVLLALVPTYIRQIPTDACTGGQFHYESKDGTTYVLSIDYPNGLCDELVGTVGDEIDLTYTPENGLREGR